MALVDFLVRTSRELPVVFSVHPRTAERLRGGELRQRLAATPDITLVEPLGYREFLGLLDASRLIITDSGGIQEEATFLGTPCITLRSNTERPITMTAGTNVLVGEDLVLASAAVENALKRSGHQPCSVPGWDGKAAHRIIDALRARLP
jgi:UDP-N-acetylglucosamine 2-epimerase (non-hydrolysing)